jgi:tetratricopeptide (TPR) repeat protein
MQALAVYGRPVPPTSVDYLLQPHLPGVDSAKVLGRLVNIYFTRKEAGRYYLHPIDRAYALSLIPRGEQMDRSEFSGPKFTQIALLRRAAEYFEQVRIPRQDWKNLADLAPQLAEIDLRFDGEDFESAVSILHDIGIDFMLRWGHYRLYAELNERLHDKLSDALSRMMNVINLGASLTRMGNVRRAIEMYEEGLEIARLEHNRIAEASFLGNILLCFIYMNKFSYAIGNLEAVLEIAKERNDLESEGIALSTLSMAHKSLGHLARAVEEGERALEIARIFNDTYGEEGISHNQGNCFFDLGQTSRAIAQYERANELNRITRDPDWESNHHEALGNCYVRLGDFIKARNCHDHALNLRRVIGNRKSEASALGNLALLAIEEGRYDEAVNLSLEGVNIARELGLPSTTGQSTLALAFPCTGHLAAARTAAEAACGYEDSDETHAYEHLLLGTIALLQGDRTAARQAFTTAAAQAETMISRCAENFDQLDIEGDALCGLAACGEPERLADAKEAYTRARVINRDVGVVKKVLRWFDTISCASPSGLPPEVRAAVSGGGDAATWPVEAWGQGSHGFADRST